MGSGREVLDHSGLLSLINGQLCLPEPEMTALKTYDYDINNNINTTNHFPALFSKNSIGIPDENVLSDLSVII